MAMFTPNIKKKEEVGVGGRLTLPACVNKQRPQLRGGKEAHSLDPYESPNVLV